MDEIPIIGSIGDPDLMKKLSEALADPACNMARDRPYNGQPWTDSGARGSTEIKGITFRDLRDCFVRAACLSAGDQAPHHYEEARKGPQARLNCDVVYELDWNKLDAIAVAQNMSCEIEKLMGIFPNVPSITPNGG